MLVLLPKSLVFSVDLRVLCEFQEKLAKRKLHQLQPFSDEGVFLLNHRLVAAPVDKALFYHCHLVVDRLFAWVLRLSLHFWWILCMPKRSHLYVIVKPCFPLSSFIGSQFPNRGFLQNVLSVFESHVFIFRQLILLLFSYCPLTGLIRILWVLGHRCPTVFTILVTEKLKLFRAFFGLLFFGLQLELELAFSLLIEFVISLAHWASLGYRHDELAREVKSLLHVLKHKHVLCRLVQLAETFVWV